MFDRVETIFKSVVVIIIIYYSILRYLTRQLLTCIHHADQNLIYILDLHNDQMLHSVRSLCSSLLFSVLSNGVSF